ncbi:MAG TPA: adenylosuccinate synthetase [Acetobacteraceae bacterium]|nr:adenylosuccinate synthetase [Acetobacteraceae bacterium]
MPVSIVVGGQFGSEGKGKVALEVVRADATVAAVVRVGGTNSGHTSVGRDGRVHALRQIPAGSTDGEVLTVLPPGAYIDLEIFDKEVKELGLTQEKVAISQYARVITADHKEWERASRLNAQIGSTESGTGAAVLAMVGRGAASLKLQSVQAGDVASLAPFVKEDTTGMLRAILDNGKRVVIEGTQGFGLSILQGGHWPKVTSRDTTAAGFLSEAGLSPRDVDDVILVIRCHPIRVAGDSGPLYQETTWEAVATGAGLTSWTPELTTVTKRIRRVGMFDPFLVRRAIDANRPDRIVLNHLDYVDAAVLQGTLTRKAEAFVHYVETEIRHRIDYVGVGPSEMIKTKKERVVT